MAAGVANTEWRRVGKKPRITRIKSRPRIRGDILFDAKMQSGAKAAKEGAGGRVVAGLGVGEGLRLGIGLRAGVRVRVGIFYAAVGGLCCLSDDP